MKRDTLFLLTHKFPYFRGEEYLWDEIPYLSQAFKQVVIFPLNCHEVSQPTVQLPSNISVQVFSGAAPKAGYKTYMSVLKALITEWLPNPFSGLFFSHLRFHLSLLKQNENNAARISVLAEKPGNTILYSYWCDELATTAAMVKRRLPSVRCISRAHGFDVFDEQSDHKHIFFRKFQLKYLSKIYSVSERGRVYLANKHKAFSNKIGLQRLGTKSTEAICFEDSETIRLVSCSYIRSIKRLDLMVDILAGITDKQVEWYVIGDGPDLEMLKQKCSGLPANITCIFKGLMTQQQISDLYSTVCFDYLVSLSSSEGLPVSMMEAISHGIPVLSTDAGGCREIVVPGISGTLIDIDFKPQSVADIIRSVKQSEFNKAEKRNEILAFWKSHYSAAGNYTAFASAIINDTI